MELCISSDVLVVVGCGGSGGGGSDVTVVPAICELVAVGLSGDGKGGEAGTPGIQVNVWKSKALYSGRGRGSCFDHPFVGRSRRE